MAYSVRSRNSHRHAEETERYESTMNDGCERSALPHSQEYDCETETVRGLPVRGVVAIPAQYVNLLNGCGASGGSGERIDVERFPADDQRVRLADEGGAFLQQQRLRAVVRHQVLIHGEPPVLDAAKAAYLMLQSTWKLSGHFGVDKYSSAFPDAAMKRSLP